MYKAYVCLISLYLLRISALAFVIPDGSLLVGYAVLKKTRVGIYDVLTRFNSYCISSYFQVDQIDQGISDFYSDLDFVSIFRLFKG